MAILRQIQTVRKPTVVSIMAEGLCIGLLAAGISAHQAAAADSAVQLPNLISAIHGLQGSSDEAPGTRTTIGRQIVSTQSLKRANFEREHPSPESRHIADWVLDSGDNQGMPFVIVDKINATVFVFDAHGLLRGAAAALLGLARGDESVPGIGTREMSHIRPDERTTPAGRFVASLDRNIHGDEILWVDYDAAISMHRVVTSNPRERRAQRLASPSALDNRISYGCINVPVRFYETVLSPAFAGTSGIVYVLPETRAAREVFASYDVKERVQLQTASLSDRTQAALDATAPPQTNARD